MSLSRNFLARFGTVSSLIFLGGLVLTVLMACGEGGRAVTEKKGGATAAPVVTTSAATAAATAAATTTAPAAAPAGGDVHATAKALFQAKGCIGCHTVTGIPGAVGTVGPNLDGVASRAKLAAGLDVTPENLKKWIKDPATVKPGTLMPSLGLTDAEIDTLVAWLLTLK